MNCWDLAKTRNNIFISTNGLNANRTESSKTDRFESVSAEKGFTISVNFPGPNIFYYEVTAMSSCDEKILVGLTSENFPTIGAGVGFLPNSYSIDSPDHCWISQKGNNLNGAKHKWSKGDVIGCGLGLNNDKKLCIFFTLNGILLGKQITINTTANTLYPTVSMLGNVSIEANFGDDADKLFKYDIQRHQQKLLLLKQKEAKKRSTVGEEQPQPQHPNPMPGDNPPKIHRTADGIEWAFLQTVPNYYTIHNIRLQNTCKLGTWDTEVKARRSSFVCRCRSAWAGCPFKLLAMKTMRSAYHIYKHGEHEHGHHVIKQKRQTSADGQQPQKKAKRYNGAPISDTIYDGGIPTLETRATFTNQIMADQKEEMEDEALPMEEEHSEDKGEYEDEDESVEFELDEEDELEEEVEDSEEYEDEQEKQGTSAAAIRIAKKKKPTEPTAAEEGNQPGPIIKNENIDDDDDIEIIEETTMKTAETGVGQLRDHSAQLKIEDNGDLSYKVHVSGCRQEDLNVELHGNKIVVRGEYEEQIGDDNFVRHQFVRSVLVPAGINKATVQWETHDGHVCISAQSESAAEPCRIPIKMKQSEKKEAQIKVEFEIHH